MRSGDRIRRRLDEEIRRYDKLIVVLSESCLASQWVEQEIESALAHERDKGAAIVIPIRIDDVVLGANSGWPALIRNTRHIGDFTGWASRTDYQAALERLLRDLAKN
jgi:hypothetical protein